MTIKRTRYEVLPTGKHGRGENRWQLTGDGKMINTYRVKANAIDDAMFLARRKLRDEGELSELAIKGRNGRIQDARTYGRDPTTTKG